MTRRFAATDEVTRARLLDSWGIIGVVASGLARRIVAAVKAYAEDWHQPPAPAATQSANERYELQTGSAASASTLAPHLLRSAPGALFRGATSRSSPLNPRVSFTYGQEGKAAARSCRR